MNLENTAKKANAIRKTYVDVGDLQVHVRTAGDRANRAIVLFHQTASDSRMFESLMLRLAERFYVVAPDTPGFGQSDAPLSDTTNVDSYADPLYATLQRLEVNGALAFGHHSGTSLAVRIARNYPHAFSRIVLSGPAQLSVEQKQVLKSKLSKVIPAEDGSHLVGMWNRIRSKDSEAPLELSQRETLANLSAGQTYVDIYQAIMAHDFACDLTQVSCPVTLAAGENDPLLPAVEVCKKTRSDAEVVSLGDSGTYVCDRHPERIEALITERVK